MTSLLTSPTQASVANDTLPAGGLDQSKFDCRAVWYPLAYEEDLDKRKPSRFTLLGEDLVIWWEANSQQWRVYADQCPHRLAPLSEGRINKAGQLECPYHGWTFAGSGQCQAIPQQHTGGQAHTGKRACVRSLPTQVAQGLLFAFPGETDQAGKIALPLVDVLDGAQSEWVCLNTFRDLPYDAFTLMENVLDSSHIPYTHHKTVGKRSNVSPVDLEIIHGDRQGFTGIWEEGPRKGTLGKQNTTFVAPGLMWHDLTSKQFGRTLTVVYATPIRPGECRLFARFPFKFPSKFPRLVIGLTPRWYSHLGQNRVLEDDQIFLHFQERFVQGQGGSPNYEKACYLPTKADLFVAEFHRWIEQYQVKPFGDSQLPDRQSVEQLMDRYHSHTEHCHSCRNALANIEKIQTGSLAIAIICLVCLPVASLGLAPNFALGLGLTVLTGLGFALWAGLGKFKQSFYQGNPIPPRNIPDKG
ncbi:aromatic ring-hydroxylating dioxygenase subunit alpha [Synechocystis sp. CACIAM 05]|uniref:aromatic ring-hydroxylating dioxygenase subunit alpha n=1 Tax=Synechocystis sp. CACIAM 05 TaxID=1933929 RepID=UPI00138E8C3D|nr:Rieske 2Fe-2S domain-containing protein [Synechocystis sp. CACIAM 05]QHU99803.1 cell death suppressor protein Lls1 [Synechocystis sp. CACIAM 05]